MVDDTDKAAKHVTGEELEMMLTEWEQPLVVDAYATWWVSDICLFIVVLLEEEENKKVK